MSRAFIWQIMPANAWIQPNSQTFEVVPPEQLDRLQHASRSSVQRDSITIIIYLNLDDRSTPSTLSCR